MIFEFLVACRQIPEGNIKQTLAELLTMVLEGYQDDFDDDAVANMIQLRHERIGEDTRLIGFALDLPDDTTPMKTVVENFARALPDTPPVSHVVRFEDPQLQAELSGPLSPWKT